MSKVSAADIRAVILRCLPKDGATIGNVRMRSLVSAELGAELEEADYFAARDALVQQGVVATGRGRGGSVRRVLEADAALTLQPQEIPESDKAPKPKQEDRKSVESEKSVSVRVDLGGRRLIKKTRDRDKEIRIANNKNNQD